MCSLLPSATQREDGMLILDHCQGNLVYSTVKDVAEYRRVTHEEKTQALSSEAYRKRGGSPRVVNPKPGAEEEFLRRIAWLNSPQDQYSTWKAISVID